MSTPNHDPTPLEAVLVDGLSSFGGQRQILARWVLTESPAGLGLDTGANFSADEDSQRDHVVRMMKALEDQPPILEWRLGRLYEANGRSQPGPMTVLENVWSLRQAWPSDDRLDAMLAAAGVDEADLLAAALDRDSLSERRLRDHRLFGRLVEQHPDVAIAAVSRNPNHAERRAGLLATAPAESLKTLAPAVAALASDASKQRQAAGAVLANAIEYETIAAEFRQLLETGDARVRADAIRAWAHRAGDDHLGDVVEYCTTHVGGDAAAGVQQALAEIGRLVSAPKPTLSVEWPQVDESAPTEHERDALRALFERTYQDRRRQYDEAVEWIRNNPKPPAHTFHWSTYFDDEPPEPPTPKSIDAALEFLRTGENEQAVRKETWKALSSAVDADLTAFTPLHLFRVLQLTSRYLTPETLAKLLSPRYHDPGFMTMLEMQAAAELAGFEREKILSALPARFRWRREHVREWAIALLPELTATVENSDGEAHDAKFYFALSTLPDLPIRLRQTLETQAVGSRSAVRPLARMVLNEFAGTIDTATGYLSSKRYEERAEAAKWLAELDATEAIPALDAAAAQEAHDLALGAELSALEKLGAPVDRFLDPDRLMVRATKELKKGMPTAASWLPLESLPELRWADGTVVDRTLTDWLVIQAVRSKSVVPSPIVRRLFERMERGSVSTFVQAILGLWIEEDLRPNSAEAAKALAAVATHKAIREFDYPDLTKDEIMALKLQHYSTAPADSAVTSKALLSLVAAGGDGAVVAPAEAYVRKWHGYRVSQSKALIEMSAWVDDPAATQFVLSIGNRFRTKAIQQEAQRQAELLAERKGWTLEDLAFRTVPDGGFDADGTLLFDYGDRTFTARLGDDLSVVVSDPDGKTIKALPAARSADDEAIVKLAKKQLADAKRTVKAAATEQPLRLREAMCAQRTFNIDDFERYVLAHPVMGRLATRLVWATGSDAPRRLFRPLSDGTLVDVHDDEVVLSTAERVTLAHELIDGAGVGEAWRSHFADYQVTPLFAQFDRPSLPELAAGQLTLDEWEGAIIEDRRLRSVAAKLGFRLNSAGDGGSVDSIKRAVPTVNLEASVGIVGLHAVAQGTEVALQSLGFVRLDDKDPVALADIPPVLLVETIADLGQIVAAGDGIDAKWATRIG